MKKTLTVNLNSIVFNIDDDAYEVLSKYLSDIASHFSSDEEKDEIMADIEARIAELFGERLQRNKEVISMSDVHEIIAVMGNPSQFSNDDSDESEQKSTDDASKSETKKKRQRRFYRDPENSILGGVCGGLAAYFNIDVTIIRIVLVALTIFSSAALFGAGGFLIPAYFIAWVIVPKAVTASQRLEMRGEDATVENIKAEFENVKSYIESEQFKSNAKSAGNRLGEVFGWIFKVFFISIGVILAFPLAIALFVIFVVLFALLIAAIFAPAAVFTEFVPSSVFDWTMFMPENSIMLLVSLLLIIGCPVFLLIRSLINRNSNKKSKSRTAIWIALVLWFAGIFMFAGTAVKSVGDWKNWENVNWSVQPNSLNNMKFNTEINTLENFKYININGNFEVKIDNSLNDQLTLSASENFLSGITTEVRDETLFISYSNYSKTMRNPVRISLSTDTLRGITASGTTKVTSNSTIKTDNFRLDIHGTSSVDLNVEIENDIRVDLSGASRIRLRGEGKMLKLNATGASRINTESLKAEQVDIWTSGASSAQVYASQSLNVDALGASRIVIFGNPENVRKNMSSGASVRMR